MKYYEHVEIKDGVKQTVCFISEADPTTSFPKSARNRHYIAMTEEVEAGTSTIEEVDDTPE